ncbi:hypothetical protein HRG_012394 [Hirsutella rhossiliensis]
MAALTRGSSIAFDMVQAVAVATVAMEEVEEVGGGSETEIEGLAQGPAGVDLRFCRPMAGRAFENDMPAPGPVTPIIIGGHLSEFDGLELIQNNSTRWNSWFHSITRALNVRERLEIFSARHVPGRGSQGISNFKLDGQHWFELEKIELALKDFFAATMLAEGNKTSLADWFSTLDCLLREINETKDHYHDIHEEDDDDNFTARSITATDNGIGNIDFLKILIFRQRITQLKYSIRIEKWVLQGDEGRQKWYESAQLAVKQLWETEYKEIRKDKDPDPAFDRQREHKRIRIDGPAAATDLYEQYISTDRLHDEEAGCDEAIAYWLSRYDSQETSPASLWIYLRFPMSDECERLFSSAKLGIVDRRGRLKADIIEACECLRAWYGKPRAEDSEDSGDSENESE